MDEDEFPIDPKQVAPEDRAHQQIDVLVDLAGSYGSTEFSRRHP